MKNFVLLAGILSVILLAIWPGSTNAQTFALAQARSSTPPAAVPVIRLTEALAELQRLYRVDILFEEATMRELTVPTDRLNRQVSLETNLRHLLTPAGFGFKKLKNGAYVVRRAGADKRATSLKPTPVESAVPTGRSAEAAYESPQPPVEPATPVQEHAVAGRVTGETGEALAGVSVVVKGTTRGTTSDAEGRYRLAVPQDGGTLVFSFVGYLPQEIALGARTSVDVQLTPDDRTLNEVIVVGYGTVKKSDLTGSVSSLKAEDFNPGANASVDQLMLGRSAGVQITQTSSEPGGGVSVRIRGASSLNAGNEPLYVIDGLPLDNGSPLSASGGGAGTGTNQNPRNPLNSINPNDIASIEILKDASATAIYGSRGANGVILITTKRGAKGKIGVNYDVNAGVQNVPNKLAVLDAGQYIRFINDLAKDEGRAPEFTDADIARIGVGTDWQDQVYQTASLSSHNLSVSGGDENTTFFSSLNYFNQEGVLKNSGIKKYIARVNLERKFGSKVVLGINLNTSVVKDLNSVDGLNNNENGGPINSALLYDPTEPIYNPDGTFSQSKNLTSSQEDNTLLSYLGRINYTLADKYLLTASLRADGSSRFGENNKFGYFPSLALGWRLAEEAFIPELFYDLKLRASWGLTGNQDIDNYASLTTYATGATAVFNNAAFVGTRPSRIANPNLKWESTEQLNIGLDASILQGRVSATLDYFIKNTRDMLINLPVPRATGFASVLTNVGRMENKGIEVLLSSTNINKEQFKWSTTLNFSAIKNTVKDIGGVTDIITGAVEAIGPTAIVRVGYPAYSYYGYEVQGIFQSGDNIAGSAQPNSRPGYPIFRDVNGDKRITPSDQLIIGSPFPDFTFGVQNTFTYKRLQLDVFFQGQKGADQLNINVLESMYPNNARRNRIAEQVLDRWTPANPTARWPSGVQPSAYGGGKVNTLALQDASYLRLKNIQVSYNLPVEKLRFIQSARLYLVGQNLATFTNYVGFDPEANAFGRSNVRLDYNGYPLARTWMLGLNIGF
jgi:TonB-dependent SusC/RagA subfamily outer membrane receptor